MGIPNGPLTLAKLTEITGDPIDALKVAADLYAMSAYRATRALHAALGRASPVEPRATSKFVWKLRAALRAKLAAIVESLDDVAIVRLKKIAPAVSAAIELDEPDVTDEIVRLLSMEPAECSAWIRDHLDDIEARFAS